MSEANQQQQKQQQQQEEAKFPHVIRKLAEGKTVPALLTQTIEDRIKAVLAIPDCNWLPFDKVEGPLKVFICGSHNLELQEPAIRFALTVNKPLTECVKFFSNFKQQKNPEINPNIRSLEVRRLVDNGKLAEFRSSTGDKPVSFSNTEEKWVERYKNVSYVYSTLSKISEVLNDIDSADLFVLRKAPEFGKAWIFASMAMFMENHVAVNELKRLENYLSVMLFTPDPNNSERTIISLTSLMAIVGLDSQNASDLQIQLGVSRLLRSLNYLTSKSTEN